MSEENKPEKRLAILLYPQVQRRVAELAKTYTLSQSDVVEVMIEVLTAQPNLEALMQAKRESKVAGRSSKTAILKSLSKLSAEQLEELSRMVEKKDAQ